MNSLIKKIRQTDFFVLIMVIVIVAFGFPITLSGAGISLMTSHIIAIFCGIALMLVLSMIDIKKLMSIKPVPYIIYALEIAFLVITLIFGSGEGNRSWVELPFLGVSFQPSELVKPLFILSFAYNISVYKNKINKPANILFLLAHAFIPIMLIMLQGDLGTALVYIGILLAIFFCLGLAKRYFFGSIGLVAALSPILWFSLKNYQKQRILVVFNPYSDPAGYGYQTLLASDCIKAGGLFGCGIGNAVVADGLPKAYNDMIFALMCEEIGFIGAFIYICLLIILVLKLLFSALNTNSKFTRAVCVGVCAWILSQAFVSIGMCLGFLPIVGITLPFVSCGGSSMLALLVGIGVAIGCSRTQDSLSEI